MNPSSWQAAPSNPQLKPHQVHIWRANIDTPPAPLSSYQSLLSPDELERAARFKFDIHRNRFIAARGILRQLLARYLTQTPQDLVFKYNEHGKPSLDPQVPRAPAANLDPANKSRGFEKEIASQWPDLTRIPTAKTAGSNLSTLQFNVSHSNEWAVYAFCLDQPIGIDIEQQKESVDGLALAQRFFSVAEYEHLQALPTSQQQDYFFQLWAYKEAFIKALGVGLSFPLADFTVNFDKEEVAVGSVGPKNATQPTGASIQLSVGATRESPVIDTQLWHLYPVAVTEGYKAAIAAEGKVDKIEMWGL